MDRKEVLYAGSFPQARKRSPLLTLLKVLYIILVILSTLVVVAYAAFRIFITPPDVGGQVIFTPDRR